jgi:hypothetical protein
VRSPLRCWRGPALGSARGVISGCCSWAPFEGLDSERGISWRCADSLSLHRFLKLGPGEAVPDHSTLSRTRARLPLEAHDAVFALVLGLRWRNAG